ncbi:MAG TPA: hypothetical protein VHK28_05100 [Candidatus Limnocylindria bacterium]|nr:hypothetical protein [Candidatus Limnocylindria bacterium]
MTHRDPSDARPRRRRARGFLPLPAALGLLAAVFVGALLAPIPTIPSASDARQVAERVEQRLPGWQVDRTLSSWEGAWTVVASCGNRQVGFQFVPGHGLRPGDAWLHPQDEFTRTRLRFVSDDDVYLIWYRDEQRPRSLACNSELARRADEDRRSGRLD